jgi:hypothetical protein
MSFLYSEIIRKNFGNAKTVPEIYRKYRKYRKRIGNGTLQLKFKITSSFLFGVIMAALALLWRF